MLTLIPVVHQCHCPFLPPVQTMLASLISRMSISAPLLPRKLSGLTTCLPRSNPRLRQPTSLRHWTNIVLILFLLRGALRVNAHSTVSSSLPVPPRARASMTLLPRTHLVLLLGSGLSVWMAMPSRKRSPRSISGPIGSRPAGPCFGSASVRFIFRAAFLTMSNSIPFVKSSLFSGLSVPSLSSYVSRPQVRLKAAHPSCLSSSTKPKLMKSTESRTRNVGRSVVHGRLFWRSF